MLNNRRASLIILTALIMITGVCFSSNRSNSELATTNSNTIDLALTAPAEQLGKAFGAIAQHVGPAVVSVFSEKIIKFHQQDMPFPFGDDLFREFFGEQAPQYKRRGESPEYRIPQTGMGSGMLLDHEGHIITNYHVVQDVDEIKVQFSNQKSYKAKIIGTDPRTDVAIIQIQGKGFESNPTVTFGNSDAVHVGDIVLAIGAPFGLAQTVTHGIISATGRADVGIADYEDFLQTDAPINPGNSGGPLVNMHGEVIGMNSAIATRVGQSGGVGFSIPSNMIKSMLPKIIKGQAITRGELGVVIQNLSEDLAKHFNLKKDTNGVLVSQVMPNSAAEKAGIKAGDVITQFDGKSVNDVRSFRNLVAATSPNSNVKIELLRDRRSKTVRATIQQQSNEQVSTLSTKKVEDGALSRLGLSVETLTREFAARFNIKASSGVVITDIAEGSPAFFAGLQEGDVIIQSNHKPIKNVDDLIKSLSDKRADSFLFLVNRMGSDMFVSIRID